MKLNKFESNNNINNNNNRKDYIAHNRPIQAKCVASVINCGLGNQSYMYHLYMIISFITLEY